MSIGAEATDALTVEPRSDAIAKASGRAVYSQDLYRPGMLHGVIVRAPRAAATVEAVEVSRANELPAIVALAPADVPDVMFGDVEPDEPLLARDHIRYMGEPVALVAGPTRAAALAAAELVDVTYGPARSTAATIETAVDDAAPSVQGNEPNVGEGSRFGRGDTEQPFAAADVVVATTIRSHRVHQGYIEPRVSLAELDHDGRLVVTTCSQAPFQVRAAIARVFALPMNRVIVRVPAFGGGFGGKLHNGMALYATALCLATRRPVQVVSTRVEEMQTGNPREGSVVRLESAVGTDGRILARRAQAYFDSGAYTYDTPYITSMGAMQAGGAYAIDAIEGVVQPVRTHTAPTGSFRAPSGPQMCFANEAHMDEIAERLGIDRIELRRRNGMRPGDLGPTGQELTSDAFGRILDEGTARLERWRREWESAAGDGDGIRGFGLASTWWFTAPGASSASVRLEEDGTATVSCGATEIGTGAVVTALVKLVAAELGLPVESVRLISADTDNVPPDYGSEGSRTMYGAGNATLEATAICKQMLVETAADELEVDPDDIVFQEGGVGVAGVPASFVPLGELVARTSAAGGPVVGTGRFQAPPLAYDEGCTSGMLIPSFNEPTFHCHVAEIEIDRMLGSLRVLRYSAIHDVGAVVNWAGVKGQIEGGVVQGLGYALYEEMLLDDEGRVRNASLVDYRMPTIADVPVQLEVVAIRDFPSATGPHGAKGIGEAPVILPAAAIASAVRHATGAPILALPVTPARVLAALREGAARDTRDEREGRSGP